MGRFKRPRQRRSTLYAVKETVAALNEELDFTLKYAQAMTREENYQAAVEVIAEQRRSLARASKRMHDAIGPGAAWSRVRARTALAGVAATIAIASTAIASIGGGAFQSEINPRVHAIQRIQQATQALTEGTAISDPLAFQALAVQAQETIIGIALDSPSDPAVQASLLASVAKLTKVGQNPNVPARVREQAKRVAENVQEVVVLVPESAEAAEESAPSEPTPAPSPSV